MNEPGDPKAYGLRIARLKDLCTMDRRAAGADQASVARLPFVGLEHVGAGTGILNLDAGSRVGNRKSTAFLFDERHVLYGKLRPYLNKVAIPEFAGCCSTEIVPLLPKEGVDRDFLAHLLRRGETVNFVMSSVTGARMPRADMKMLMSMQAPFPQLDEQRRIAGILNKSARIEKLRATMIDCVRGFSLSLFRKMFGDPAEQSGDEEIFLGDITTSIESGFACGKSNRVDKGLAHLRPFNIGRNVELDMTEIYRVPHNFAPKSKNSLYAGDIMFNNTNSPSLVGKIALVRRDVEAGFSNHMTRIRVDRSQCEPAYIASYMQYLWLTGYYRNRCTQWVSQAAYGPRLLSRTPVHLPPLDRQRQFAQMADRTTSMARAIETGAEAASSLSASLMAHLLEQSR